MQKESSTHHYEIGFILSLKGKIIPIEVKSGNIKRHESMDAFSKKYSNIILKRYLLCQKDIGHGEMLNIHPMYLMPFILEG